MQKKKKTFWAKWQWEKIFGKLWVIFLLHFFPHKIKWKRSNYQDHLRISSVQLLSHVWFFATPWTKHTRPPCSSPTPGAWTNSHPLSQWCHTNIASSVIPFSSYLQSFPASGSFQISQLFALSDQSIGASVLPISLVRTDFLYDGLVGAPCSSRDSQKSSPTSQFKSINCSALSFLHGPTLTSIHDYWENHSFYYMDPCWQSNVSVF